ncbi:MAG: hypothetical protein AAB527_02260 [Patescibacteria group bacterium]
MKRLFYILVALLILLVVLLLASSARLYPVLKINNSFVWASDYYDRFSGFEYYRLMTSEPIDEKTAVRGLILSFIADSLVEDELLRRGADLREAEKRVKDALMAGGVENLEKAAASLYGWDIEEFKKFSLFPQAREDILTEVLQKDGIDFDEWLLREMAKADIKIYFLPHKWENGKLSEK